MKDHEKNRQRIGYRLQCAITDKKMTQTDVARKLGIDTSVVSNWCNGKVYPQMANLIDACEAIGVTVGQIVDGQVGEMVKEVEVIKEVPVKIKLDGLETMKGLHNTGAISDRIFYAFLLEKLEEINE